MLVKNPILIVGPGRSGTTLLRSLLSAHSRIAVTPETHFLARADGSGLSSGAPRDFHAFWDKYTNWVRFKDLDVDPDRCLELITSQGDRSFKTIFGAVLTAYRERTGKELVGEKTPGHTLYLRYLMDWFPEARVLVMQRDPRAVVASQLGTPYVQKRIKPLSLRQGLVQRKRLREVAFFANNWAEVFEVRVAPWQDDPRFHNVSYEALVQNTEDEMRAICTFLGEPYEETMLTERTRKTVPMPAGTTPDDKLEQWRREHHNKSLAPVSSDSLDKWKRKLTAKEVAMIEGRCWRSMSAAGYPCSVTPLQGIAGSLLVRSVLKAASAESGARRAIRKVRRPFVAS